MTTDIVFDDAKKRMVKSIESTQRDLNIIRTGRASPAIIEHLSIDYYGTLTPLNQIAGISALDPKTLVIQPWDKTTIQAIEKSILTSDLGLNPAVDSTSLTIPIPTLTEDRRKDRRDSLDKLRTLEKEKSISQNDLLRGQKTLQTMTDEHISAIEIIAITKEKEIMQV